MQSKTHSIFESLTNTAVGLLVSIVLNLTILPLVLGVQPSAAEVSVITAVYTGVSILRGYAMRRLFNHITGKHSANSSDRR